MVLVQVRWPSETTVWWPLRTMMAPRRWARAAAAVEMDRAGPAVACVAPDDRAGLAEGFTQIVDEERSGLDVVGVADPVDRHCDPGHP